MTFMSSHFQIPSPQSHLTSMVRIKSKAPWWPTILYRPSSHVPSPLISSTILLYLHFSHPGLFAVPPLWQPHTHLRAFPLTLLTIRSISPHLYAWPFSFLHLDFGSNGKLSSAPFQVTHRIIIWSHCSALVLFLAFITSQQYYIFFIYCLSHLKCTFSSEQYSLLWIYIT